MILRQYRGVTPPLSELFAHSVPGCDRNTWEPLHEHLTNVGRLASVLAAPFGASQQALAAGLLHDIGKCSAAYQRYIAGAVGSRGPDHSTAGAREAVALYGPRIGRMIAYAVAAHHAGLMDGNGQGWGNTLDKRLNRAEYPIEDYPGWRDQIPHLPTPETVRRERARGLDPQHQGFGTAFHIRMLFSCLVDADRLATEQFYATVDGLPPPARGGTATAEHLERVRSFMAGRGAPTTPLDVLRNEILDHAVAKAALPPGFFTLTVPTGGGKTLTSLRFALEHAVAHGLRRVVYVIPYTSIIEQTAQVFREEVGLGDAILEHHSSFDWDKYEPDGERDREDEGAAGLTKLRRDAQNWDAPIIVTTGVQFWESLFAAAPGRARKLHNLAGSVIILDEVQMVPLHRLRPCMAALDALVRGYGATVVLCTATQPALRQIDKALQAPKGRDSELARGFAIGEDRELAPRPAELYRDLKRVRVEWRREPVADAEIAARFAEQERMLCIVNSRRHASDLFATIRAQDGARHLTTLMCARHRRKILGEVRADLAAQRPVRLVATSLIEAGVDVDFPEVWRAATGLDSIAQAAGRCNREGRLDGLGRTVVFKPLGREAPPALKVFYEAARSVLRGKHDPLSLEAVHAYFCELYFRHSDNNKTDRLDAAKLNNSEFEIVQSLDDGIADFSFPFARVAQAFRLIEQTMTPILVPWDDAAERALDTLEHARLPPGDVLRALQQYAVPVPAAFRSNLLAIGGAVAIRQHDYGDRFVRLPDLAQYDDALGLRIADPEWRAAESNVL